MQPIKEDNILPADFDGVFRFTNASDRDFTAKWNGIAYTFPAMSTSPMIISNATPEEVQHIRKMFAKKYAEREFGLSGRYDEMNKQAPAGSGVVPAIYSETDIAPYVQQCLEPLPVARATAVQTPKETTSKYHTDVTKVLDNKDFEGKTALAEGSAAIV